MKIVNNYRSGSVFNTVLLVCTALVIAATTLAAPPSMFSYQGRLTDPGGSPVPDGVYSVLFQIWNAPIGGLSLWSSGATSVTTTDGLFAIRLGQSPQPALPVVIFYDSLAYLGITVGIDPEIVPRTQIVAAPYSLTTGTIESAQGGRVFGDLYMNNGAVDYVQTNQSNHMIGTWNAVGIEATRIWGPSWGQFIAFNGSGVATASLSASAGGTPYMELNGTDFIYLQGIAGDNAAFFPNDAINSSEILNEPGLSQRTGGIVPSAAAGVWEDAAFVDINIPAPGYILVTVDGEISVAAAAGTSTVVKFGLGETSAAAPVNGTYFVGDFSTPNLNRFYHSFSSSTVFFKGASGNYPFYLTVTRDNAANAASVYRPHLQAIYIPTSYGPVISPVPQSMHGEFTDGKLSSNERTGEQELSVDLRELETKAAKLKAEAMAAELALVKARNRQDINQSRNNSSADDKR